MPFKVITEEIYINFAVDNNYKFIIVAKDLEDMEIFPIYFSSEKEAINYQNNIISESKIKIIKVLKVKHD